MPRPRLFLIDSFGFIFRAYHARARSGAPPMRTSTGIPTEAVYIFNNMLRKLVTAYEPQYMAAVMESTGPTFRDTAFTGYKANRAAMPPDLAEQIPYIHRLLDAMRVTKLEYEGFEADDVIGTIARRAEEAGVDTVIVSSDKDMLQLVNEHVWMYNPAKDDVWYDPAKVEEFMGVPPLQVADLLALKGDAIDNIPGAPGIGDKGARDLILRFGSVEQALEHAAEVERKTYRESLLNNRDQVVLSKQLATIDTAVPIPWKLEDTAVHPPDLPALRKVYKELEFFSLLRALEPAAEDKREKTYLKLESAGEVDRWVSAIPADAPVAVAVRPAAEGELALGTLGLCWKAGEAAALSFEYLESVRPLLEDAARAKVAHDLKALILALKRREVELKGCAEDVMLYGFLLSADPSACSMEVLMEKHFDRRVGPAAEERAEGALELACKLGPEIDSAGLRKLYEEIELPLVSVLARVESNGIRIDPAELKRLSVMMDASLQRLTAEIHALAGKPFNINSPQQLGKILFEDLKLPAPVRYGKGKAISTAADVLEGLAAEHEIARKVLEYRQLSKLKGTYVDALPVLIDPVTRCLHTTFNQAGAATGRLSSSNPNLQNIPIRTELGREIRAAFVPREGWKLIVADYSQIELRLLAHLSQDPVLLEAFRHGEDIHTRTAAEVFGVPPLMVTSDMRRNAKAVNFGIVYGQTPFGLAGQLGIDRKEAETYIRKYFERYRGVKTFIESTIEDVRKTGVVRTMFGRLRPIPEILSRNPNARGFAERTAVNTPLQGSAADLIKLAMIAIDRELSAGNRRARMLLQVHDELIFEAPPDELQDVAKMVKREMEAVDRLSVPLLAEVGIGDNWRDAK